MVVYHLQVYVVAQRMSEKSTIEQYAVALAQHFVRTYPLVRLRFFTHLGLDWL